MPNQAAYKFVPVVTDDKKIEVTLKEGEAVIRLSEWVEDLGWCGQKTLAVDEQMLDELHRVIAAARVRMKSRRSEAAEIEDNTSGRILNFPSAA